MLLSIAYLDYVDDRMGKPPAQLKDLERFYGTDQPDRLKKNVRENIDIVWNAKLGEGPSANKVIIYERNADKDGNRLVVTTDGKLRFMDEAEFRHGVPSVNSKWDNSVAILSGDFLFAKASELSADLGAEVTRLLARTIATVCDGQIRDVTTAGSLSQTEAAQARHSR